MMLKNNMFGVSIRTLNIIAALIWLIGGMVLFLKGSSLFFEAYSLKANIFLLSVSISISISLGLIKAKFIISKSCRKNLDRISSLENPKIYQFYSPKFFILLTLMMTIGATLSRMAHKNIPFLIGVGILDISISVSLLSSIYIFWEKNAFSSRA